MEILVRVFGMCIAFLPSIIFASYIINKAKSKQKFDAHLDNVRDKYGVKGVMIAYISRVSLFILITSLGVLISSYFGNKIALDVCIVSFILFVFSSYLDYKWS